MATKEEIRAKDIVPHKTSFGPGDGFYGDGNTSFFMEAEKLLELTAQNALAGNVAPAFDATRTEENPYKVGENVVYEGKLYTFKADHYGAWAADDVRLKENLVGILDDTRRKATANANFLNNFRDYDFYKKDGALNTDGTLDTLTTELQWFTLFKIPFKKGTFVLIKNVSGTTSDDFITIAKYDSDSALESSIASASKTKQYGFVFEADGYLSVTSHKGEGDVLIECKTVFDKMVETFNNGSPGIYIEPYKIFGAITSDGSYTEQPGEEISKAWYVYYKVPVKKGAVVRANDLFLVSTVGFLNYALYDNSGTFVEGGNGTSIDLVMQYDGYISIVSRVLAPNTNVSITYESNVNNKFETFSVIGDSYSTYLGYIPEGNNCYYGDGEHTPVLTNGVFDTWWFRLAKETGAVLWLNESLSGATISNKVRPTQDVSVSFVNRVLSKFANNQITQPKPKVIFFFGGTNDSWVNSNHGQVQYSGWTSEDLMKCVNAFCYCMDQLLRWNPGVKIVNIVNTDLSSDIVNGMATACEHYGITNVVLSSIDKVNGHPTSLGMAQICSQVMAAL